MSTQFLSRLVRPIRTEDRRDEVGAIGGIPEQVIAIAVGVLMVAGMIALGSRAFTGGKANVEMANVNQIATDVRAMHAGVNSYTGLNNVMVTTGELAPQSMVIGARTAGTLQNSFGGTVTVAAATNVVAGDSFSITSNSIPDESCRSLAVKTPSEGLVSVSINGTVTLSNALPITPAQAITQCNQPAGNTIIWTFR